MSVMTCVCQKSGKKNNKQTEGEIKNLDRTNTLQRTGGTTLVASAGQHCVNKLQVGPSTSSQKKSGSLVASGGSGGQGWVGGA